MLMRWMDELCIFGFHTQLHIVCTSHGDGFKQENQQRISKQGAVSRRNVAAQDLKRKVIYWTGTLDSCILFNSCSIPTSVSFYQPVRL